MRGVRQQDREFLSAISRRHIMDGPHPVRRQPQSGVTLETGDREWLDRQSGPAVDREDGNHLADEGPELETAAAKAEGVEHAGPS